MNQPFSNFHALHGLNPPNPSTTAGRCNRAEDIRLPAAPRPAARRKAGSLLPWRRCLQGPPANFGAPRAAAALRLARRAARRLARALRPQSGAGPPALAKALRARAAGPGRRAPNRCAALFLPSYCPAVCPSTLCRARAAPSCAAGAFPPIRPGPHRARRLGGLCAGARRPQFRPRRLIWRAAPCASFPAPARVRGGLPWARARPSVRGACGSAFCAPAPARAACLLACFSSSARTACASLCATSSLFSFVSRSIARAKASRLFQKLFFPLFFIARFPSFLLCAFFVRGPGPAHKENGRRGAPPGGHAAHAARCVRP